MASNQVSARLQYATIAMMELALRYESGELTCVRDIAARHDIPLPFLTQILNQLRAHGLVQSVRGSCGGYRLARAPDSITMAEIRAVWESPVESSMLRQSSELGDAAEQVWADANRVLQQYLSSVRLDALVDQLSSNEQMFHI